MLQKIHEAATAAGLRLPAHPPPKRSNTTCTYPVFDKAVKPACVSPLNPAAWDLLLANYPDRDLRRNIVGMIRHAAKLGYEGVWTGMDRKMAEVPNLEMDDKSMEHVRETVGGRQQKGWASGVVGMDKVVVSPIGTVPMANGKMRTINHPSWPRNRHNHPSVNNEIDGARVTMTYDKLDYLFNNIWKGKRGTLWKGDLTDGHFHVVVAASDSPLLRFHMYGVTYEDNTFNFGGKSSPFIFNLFAKAFHWILQSFGMDCTHYLYDSFCLTAENNGEAVQAFVQMVAQSLGLQRSPTKSTHGERIEILERSLESWWTAVRARRG